MIHTRPRYRAVEMTLDEPGRLIHTSMVVLSIIKCGWGARRMARPLSCPTRNAGPTVLGRPLRYLRQQAAVAHAADYEHEAVLEERGGVFAMLTGHGADIRPLVDLRIVDGHFDYHVARLDCVKPPTTSAPPLPRAAIARLWAR